MKILLIISSLIVVQAGISQGDCDGVQIKDICYEREVLKSGIGRPNSLAVDLESDTVYFNYDVNENSVFNNNYQIAKVNINTKEFEKIKGVNDGFGSTIDPKNHVIFIGGRDGIYKYDPSTNKAILYAKKEETYHVFFKDTLYYSMNYFLYTLSSPLGQSTRLKYMEDTRVKYFVIDNDDEMFFMNSTGLIYSRKKNTKDTVSYDVKTKYMYGLAVDANGVVYICAENGIYAVKKATKSLEKIVKDRCFGLAFDSGNNIVYGDKMNLIRLKQRIKHVKINYCPCNAL